MVILFTPTGLLEVLVFLSTIVTFVFAVRFFISSRQRLEEAFPGIIGNAKWLPFRIDRNGFVIPRKKKRTRENLSKPFQHSSPASDSTKEEMKALRSQVRQQQLDLAKALEQISLIAQPTEATKEVLAMEEQRLLQEHRRLQASKKDSEIQQLLQQEKLSQSMQDRFEEMQTECNQLHEKIQRLETEGWQAAELSLQLEHAAQLQAQAEKSLFKKEEKLRELTLENQQLQDACNDLEEKLSHANLQRQQLLRKVQFLEELNAEMVKMAEANRKLKAQVTRVAELESMVELMTEERNVWRKRS